MLTRTPRPLSDRARGLGRPSCECGNKRLLRTRTPSCQPDLLSRPVSTASEEVVHGTKRSLMTTDSIQTLILS